jgi:DNA-binding SARP family transcriptional activator
MLEMELGMAYSALGNDEAALRFYQRALKTWEEAGNLGWQATLLNNMGVLYHSMGAYEQAFTMLEKALEYARRTGYARMPALALCSLGDLLADMQDFDRCEECYDQALALPSQLIDGYLVFYAMLAKARVARLRGDFQRAEKLLLDLFPRLQRSVSLDEEALYRLENGCLLLCLEQEHESVAQLTRAVELYENSGRLLDICISRVWLASALNTARRPEDAAEQLRALFSEMSNLKEPGPLYINTEQAYPWLEKITTSSNLASPLKQLITNAHRFGKNIPGLRRKLRQISHIISISPPHIAIQALGPAQVLYNGKKISLSDWQTRETRDLFFFFLQSKAVTKEEIASIFWPDISPSRLKMRFKTSIYRLRHAVGQETILFEDERYEFNHGIDYEYDVEKFQQILGQADKTQAVDEVINLLIMAIDLVKGPYMADVDAAWADSERNRFDMQYQGAILRLAQLQLEAGHTQAALEACRTVLLINPLLEEAYRLNMRAYAILGDRAAVARQFRICSDIFEEELGVKPSKETELLYKRLI